MKYVYLLIWVPEMEIPVPEIIGAFSEIRHAKKAKRQVRQGYNCAKYMPANGEFLIERFVVDAER
jgi:hypothetical protein